MSSCANEVRTARAQKTATSEFQTRPASAHAAMECQRAPLHSASAPTGGIVTRPATGRRPSQVPVRSIPVPAASPPIQRKQVISSPGGPDEHEADDLAEAVLAMPDHTAKGSAQPMLQRKCTGCENEEKEPIKTKQAPSASKGTALDPGPAVSAARHGGTPLPGEVRSYFEPRFGHDFSEVRVHVGPDPAAGAQAVQARAYTIGNEIVFGAGEFAPATSEGKRLLAHELAHTVQQAGTVGQRKIQREELDVTPDSGMPPDGGALAPPSDALTAGPSNAPSGNSGPSSALLTDPAQVAGQLSAVTAATSIPAGAQRLCFPPSLFAPTDQWASGFGTLAERYIEQDYCGTPGISCIPGPAGTVYFDQNNPTGYRNFLETHNPSLKTLSYAAKIAAYVAEGIQRPDILSDDAAQKEYYEIKPLSPSGAAKGVEKLAFIVTFMTALGLPYSAGTTYSPSKDIPIMSAIAFGQPIAVSLNVQRYLPGMITYTLCLSGNLAAILAVATMAALLAWVAEQIMEKAVAALI